MMSISSNVFFGACALILLGLHFETHQIDARSYSIVSEDNYVVENQLTDDSIEHPERSHGRNPKEY
uniref:Secreted protein n=1 Tax=Cucumis melo TaxID=3656 RepID=A0A9I9E930_CUCME